jgi:hypothetical protein
LPAASPSVWRLPPSGESHLPAASFKPPASPRSSPRDCAAVAPRDSCHAAVSAPSASAPASPPPRRASALAYRDWHVASPASSRPPADLAQRNWQPVPSPAKRAADGGRR